jgi:hypothetical protein
MVEIPKFYWKFSESGNTQSVMLSQVPIEGYTKVPKRYISAYEATVDNNNSSDTSTWKLASVKSMETRYRGCNNSSAKDGTYKTGLGMPRTNVTLENYRTYARRRKSGTYEWNCYDYMSHKILFWLYVVEYATRHSQKSVSDTTTVSGFKTGGLGAGVTTLTDAEWNSYFNCYPIIPCGTTDALGNGSGQVAYNVPSSAVGETLKVVQVSRYRGIENPFGHISKMTDGAKFMIESGDTNNGESKFYACYTPSQYGSATGSSTGNYIYIGNEPRQSGWVKEIFFGSGGDLFCKTHGGSDTTYYTDYHNVSIPATGSTQPRLALFGGYSNVGTLAGFVYSFSNHAFSSAIAGRGSRLCFIPNAT